MILPGKHIRADRSLVVIGGEILRELGHPKTVSELWDAIRKKGGSDEERPALPYDWFVQALTLLYAISAVRLENDRIHVERRA